MAATDNLPSYDSIVNRRTLPCVTCKSLANNFCEHRVCKTNCVCFICTPFIQQVGVLKAKCQECDLVMLLVACPHCRGAICTKCAIKHKKEVMVEIYNRIRKYENKVKQQIDTPVGQYMQKLRDNLAMVERDKTAALDHINKAYQEPISSLRDTIDKLNNLKGDQNDFVESAYAVCVYIQQVYEKANEMCVLPDDFGLEYVERLLVYDMYIF